ncbi:flagellin [Jeongeupia naejangsanensis]|uniref:Flagellin n=1 Tax=Jeongeupia naejangsanensis TaxID=613195 RepID=A0ABS2BGI8_9NEIS|nr:flagellin [Jeongeupia naejangsanensis]MBM3114732.1 Lateral flagellin [Jeongeupia naejangsanensis]
MLSLHTNAASLSTQNNLHNTQSSLSTSLSRLGTGYRINSAMDDAAGLQIATRLNAQTSGMAVAMRNTQNGISMMQTAEGAFNEMTNILTRMKDLATQAADASSTATDQTAMQAEYDSLGLELSNVMKNTSFGGQSLLDPTGGKLAAALKFQIGASAAEVMDVDVSTQLTAVDTALTAVSGNYTAAATGTELTAAGGANGQITKLSTALDKVGELRSALGANSNRLDHVYNNLSNMSTTTQEARGRIMDVDYASETANMTTHQMLMQAGTSMLKQSNSMSQLVMSLMQ